MSGLVSGRAVHALKTTFVSCTASLTSVHTLPDAWFIELPMRALPCTLRPRRDHDGSLSRVCHGQHRDERPSEQNKRTHSNNRWVTLRWYVRLVDRSGRASREDIASWAVSNSRRRYHGGVRGDFAGRP